ncbi:MAG: YceI family protein [Pseudomonadales bacterium]|jgi:polyisoprenoid-binding protein YceI
MKKIALLILITVAPFNLVFADDYVIDGSDGGRHSSIHFKAKHVGISSLWGRFNGLTGHFSYSADDIADTVIDVSIDPASIDSNHEARDTHLRTSDYLSVESYPAARFTSSSVEDLGNGHMRVNGTFSLHGATNDISFDAARTGEGESPFGDYRVGFEGELVLNTEDYGINAGTIELVLAIEGIRQ